MQDEGTFYVLIRVRNHVLIMNFTIGGSLCKIVQFFAIFCLHKSQSLCMKFFLNCPDILHHVAIIGSALIGPLCTTWLATANWSGRNLLKLTPQNLLIRFGPVHWWWWWPHSYSLLRDSIVAISSRCCGDDVKVVVGVRCCCILE